MPRLTILSLTLLLVSAAPLRFFSQQQVVATIQDQRLEEVSGLEESYKNPGFFWTHNDSDSDPFIYLIDEKGFIRMEVELKDIVNRDWEEIVSVKKGDESFIYIAEIGDNKAVHDHVKLVRLEEPKFTGTSYIQISKEELQIMNFRYAEGSRDAEAVLYDDRFGEFVLVTKREKNALVYSFPFQPGKNVVTINSKGIIPTRNLTAADMNEDGEILIKHYDEIYFWESSTERAVDRILKWQPITVEYSPEPQGEAICWHNGDFYTISEKNTGKPQEMLFFERLK